MPRGHPFMARNAIFDAQEDPSSVFGAWAADNGKAYTPEDIQTRLPIFSANVARQIERLGLSSGSMAVNGLADISREEFKATHLGHVSRSTVTELGCGQTPTTQSKGCK